MIEFDCEGCGVHVVDLGTVEVPESRLCAVCGWLCEFVPDPVEMMEMRKRLDAEGVSDAMRAIRAMRA
jgi:hypothetical protein